MSILFLNITTPNRPLSENFSKTEVLNASHPDEGEDVVLIDGALIDIAQYIRDQINSPININSAYRNAKHNATLANSSKNSQHILGKAFDLSGQGILEFMLEAFETKNQHWVNMYDLGLRGIGFYDWGVHIDTRDSIRVANWDYRKKKIVESVGQALSIPLVLLLIYFFFNKVNS